MTLGGKKGEREKNIPFFSYWTLAFYEVHRDIAAHRHVHYWLKGGRGSGKSSFVSLEIILGMMADPKAHAVVLRKVAVNLKDSVFEQLWWAIRSLGVEDRMGKQAVPYGNGLQKDRTKNHFQRGRQAQKNQVCQVSGRICEIHLVRGSG